MDANDSNSDFWSLTKGLSLVGFTTAIVIKLIISPFSINVDFPTLMSLLLALFSVGLSALFYFKATETSNAFYDNTYKFTKDIAELLVKIESGFGEKLRHLDEGYSSMRNYLEKIPSKHSDDIETTKQKIENEKREIEKVLNERNKIVDQLLERSELQTQEKESIIQTLKSKELELEQSQSEIAKLNRRLAMERMVKRSESSDKDDFNYPFNDFTINNVIRDIGPKRILVSTRSEIANNFNRIADKLPRGYINDLREFDLYDTAITAKGIHYLRYLAKAALKVDA